MEIPVYVFTGFLESGKTTLIKETLLDPGFTDLERTLILCLEEGSEIYEEAFLKKVNADLVLMDPEDWNNEILQNLDQTYSFDRVIIECNGMTDSKRIIYGELPDEWLVVQVLSTIDASTFQLYINNMRSLIYQQIQFSEVIIFNRCNEETNLSMLRSNIKAVNPRAQLIYENEDGSMREMKETELPFDVNQERIVISDEDYGLWYIDATEHPRKYAGKQLVLKGKVMQMVEGAKHSFLFGRQAMVCCADDMAMLALVVSGVKIEELSLNQWVTVVSEAILQEDDEGYEILVLKALQLAHAEPLQDELVYFS